MSAEWVRRTAVASVLLVALVAAIVSYCHMQHLAEESGEEWRSNLIPLSVDGMLVAATLAIVDRRRVGRPAGWVPWLGLSLGILASLAANIAAARSDPISRAIAAWPPVALAVAVETLVVVLRESVADVPMSLTNGHRGESRTSEPEPPAPCDFPTPIKANPKPPRPKPTTVPETSDVSTDSKKAAAAERSRRSRRHQAGDHSMCAPDRCPDVPIVTSRNNGVKVEVPV